MRPGEWRAYCAQSVAVVLAFGTATVAYAQDPPVNALLIGQWDEYEGIYSTVGDVPLVIEFLPAHPKSDECVEP